MSDHKPASYSEKNLWSNLDGSGKRTWLPFHHTSYYNSIYESTVNEQSVITLAVPIKNEYNVPPGSIIWIDMKADALLQLFHTFEKDTKSYFEIRDRSGAIVYRSYEAFTPSDRNVKHQRLEN